MLTLYHTMTTFDTLKEKALLKTLWEKKKMLVTSIFFFSHNVFYPMNITLMFSVTFNLSSANAFNLGEPKILSSGKGLILYHTIPTFNDFNRGLLKTLWEKEKMLVTSNFSFSHNVFYPFEELSTIFISLKLSPAKSFD